LRNLWLLALAALPGGAWAQTDIEFWPGFTWNQPVGEKTTFTLFSEMWNRDDAHEAYQYYLGPVLTHNAKEWLQLRGAVKQIFTKRASGGFNSIQRYEGEVNFRGALAGFGLHQRNRYEYFRLDGGPDRKRMRSRLRFNRPIAGAGLLRALYWDGEYLFDPENGDHLEVRIVTLGGSFALGKLRLNLHHMFRDRRNAPDAHVFAASFSL